MSQGRLDRLYAPMPHLPWVMNVTVRLPGELVAALEAEGARRGQTPDQVAAELLTERLASSGARRRPALAATGTSAFRPQYG